MRMKKILAVLLALVLCMGVLTACEAAPAETTAPTTESTTAPTAESTTTLTEPEAFSFEGKSLDVLSGHDINDLPLDHFIEEATGLSIQWTPRGTDEQLVAMMTSEVTPSVMFGYGPAYGHEMGRYGALVNLYDWYDEMPNFFAHYESYGEDIKRLYETGEKELYSAPIFLNGDVQHLGWMYREDIFEELDLEAPTTWEEFLAVCEALKQAYPDSYPFTLRAMTGNMTGFYDLAQQFGVDYESATPSLDRETGTWYNAYTTDEARNMLSMLRYLIEKGYTDVASLSYSTAEWIAAMSSGRSFITHAKAFHLNTIENGGQEMDPEFSIAWWNNLPLVESDLPYQCHATADYASYCWYVTTRCPDVELAVRYLDWLYSEEGSLILSWGKEGESYEADEKGNKSFLEGYDATYQGRYQESGYIDMKATAAAYSEKCQEMIWDTMAVSEEGDFWAPPTLVWNTEEQNIMDTYSVDWINAKNAYYQKFLLGEENIADDDAWARFKAEMAGYNEEEILKCYNDAYARYVAGE